MNISNITYAYVANEEVLFDKILDFRFKTFFEPFRLGKGIVPDELDPVSIHLVAMAHNQIVGYVRITLGAIDAQISQMSVDLPARKKGIGRQLLDKALDRIREAKLQKVYVNSRLNGLKFYEKMGFYSIGDVFASKKTGLLHMRMEKVLN